MTAQLCPACLAANIIAPANGPTCRHSEPTGVKWWPENWSRMLESERVAWLEKKPKLNDHL
jgi:hypothetical protein